MNQLSGYIEIDFNGDILPFKFGTNAWALFCESRKIEFYEIVNTGVFGKIEEGGTVSAPNVFALRDLFYYAYVSAVRSKGGKEYNIEKFTELLDDAEGAVKKLRDAMMTAKTLGFVLLAAKEGKDENFPKT